MEKHAAIIILNDKDEILFMKRSMKKKTLPGAWSFPSGTVEKTENVRDTTIREAMEELGVEVKIKEEIDTLKISKFSTELVFMLCEIVKGEPSICESDEIDELKWMTLSDFFNKFSDDEIGHGLIWLRNKPNLWEKIK